MGPMTYAFLGTQIDRRRQDVGAGMVNQHGEALLGSASLNNVAR